MSAHPWVAEYSYALVQGEYVFHQIVEQGPSLQGGASPTSAEGATLKLNSADTPGSPS